MPIPKPLSAGEETLALHLRAYGIAFEREYRFDPTRKWRVDFAIPRKMLAIEVEGGLHVMGRHNRAQGYAADLVKYNALALAGWRLLRYTPEMVVSGAAIWDIVIAVNG